MKQKETLRQQLGLKQRVLATWLGVSLELLAQYEIDRRNLPAPARMKLKMQLLMLPKIDAPTAGYELPFAQRQREKTAQMLKRYAADCQYKLRLADRKLAALQKICEQSLQLLALVNALDEKEPEGTMDKLWLQIRSREALGKLEQCGLTAQTKLQLRISSLQQQGEKANELLAGIEAVQPM